jgi:hypothetical protein
MTLVLSAHLGERQLSVPLDLPEIVPSPRPKLGLCGFADEVLKRPACAAAEVEHARAGERSIRGKEFQQSPLGVSTQAVVGIKWVRPALE